MDQADKNKVREVESEEQRRKNRCVLFRKVTLSVLKLLQNQRIRTRKTSDQTILWAKIALDVMKFIALK